MTPFHLFHSFSPSIDDDPPSIVVSVDSRLFFDDDVVSSVLRVTSLQISRRDSKIGNNPTAKRVNQAQAPDTAIHPVKTKEPHNQRVSLNNPKERERERSSHFFEKMYSVP